MKEVEINYSGDPIERLENEIVGSTSSFEKTLGNYLLEQLKSDSVLKDCYFEKKIALLDIVKYVNEQAKTYLDGSNGAIEGKVVYGWVLHYVQDGEKDKSIKMPKYQKNNYKLSIQDETDLKEEAKKEFLAAEKKKLAEAKKKEAEKIKKAQERAKKKMEESGQLDLFDFGGDA